MKEKLKLLDLVLIIVTVLLLAINIILCITVVNSQNKVNTNKTQVDKTNNVKTNEVKNEEDERLAELKDMGERDRMEYYFSQYIEFIEEGNYDKAYNLLYPEFRNNYFPSIDKFKEYVRKMYPEFASFSYKNIERQGTIYVLDIDIIDVDNKKNNKSQRIVIQEYDFNNFVISFQVI